MCKKAISKVKMARCREKSPPPFGKNQPLEFQNGNQYNLIFFSYNLKMKDLPPGGTVKIENV